MPRRHTGLTVKLSLLLALLVIAGGSGGCVSGMTPVGWSGAAVSDNTCFLGSGEGRLVTVNLVDEQRQWSDAMSTPSGGFFSFLPSLGGCSRAAAVAVYGTPAISGDLVYLGAYNGKVYAYDKNNLRLQWTYPPGKDDYLEPIIGGVTVADGRVFFGVSDENSDVYNVYALDALNGNELWKYKTGGKVWSTPAINGDTLYIGSFDHYLYALNTADGSLRWRFATEGAISASPLYAGGTVYIGSFDQYLYAVDAASGGERWKFKGENWFWAKPVKVGDAIYAGCLDGNVYVLGADDGREITRFDLGGAVSSSPVISGDAVIFASQAGEVFRVDTADNALTLLASIGAEVSGPLCEYDGIVYLHTADLKLHRVKVATGAVLYPISLEKPD